MSRNALWCGALGLLAGAGSLGQPPLPTDELPREVGVITALRGAEIVTLSTGRTSVFSETVALTGVAAVTELAPGDAVEVVYDQQDRVAAVRLLPRRARTCPLVDASRPAPGAQPVTWRDGETLYPGSLLAAEAVLSLTVNAAALEGLAVYRPAPGEAAPAVFRVLDAEGQTLWAEEVNPGQAAAFRCRVSGTAALHLQGALPGGRTPPAGACIWASPRLVLAESEAIPLEPAAADTIVAALAAVPAAAGVVGLVVALPDVIGLSPEMAPDLQDDLLVAAARRFRVVGKLRATARQALPADQQEAAKALGADAVLASRLVYAEDGPQVTAWVVSVEDAVTLAEATSAPGAHGQ